MDRQQRRGRRRRRSRTISWHGPFETVFGIESAIDLSVPSLRTLSTRPWGGCSSSTSSSLAATSSSRSTPNARHMRRSVPNWLISSGSFEPLTFSKRSAGPAGLDDAVGDLRDLEVGVDLGARRGRARPRARGARSIRGGRLPGCHARESRARRLERPVELCGGGALRADVVRQPPRSRSRRGRRGRRRASRGRRSCPPRRRRPGTRARRAIARDRYTERARRARRGRRRPASSPTRRRGRAARAVRGSRASRSAARASSSPPRPSSADGRRPGRAVAVEAVGACLGAEREQLGEVRDGGERAGLGDPDEPVGEQRVTEQERDVAVGRREEPRPAVVEQVALVDRLDARARTARRRPAGRRPVAAPAPRAAAAHRPRACSPVPRRRRSR